jgi:hypothetical protein
MEVKSEVFFKNEAHTQAPIVVRDVACKRAAVLQYTRDPIPSPVVHKPRSPGSLALFVVFVLLCMHMHGFICPRGSEMRSKSPSEQVGGGGGKS